MNLRAPLQTCRFSLSSRAHAGGVELALRRVKLAASRSGGVLGSLVAAEAGEQQLVRP
jgi:hypothetical protein